MAVTAKFVADFTTFQDAVDKSVTKLKDFQSGAAGVEKALSRMADSFSGRKILQEGTLAVKAVNDLGGVSKLTASEQTRLNGIVTEAIAKYRALGLEAPADMQKIAKETQQTSGVMDAIKAKLGGMGPAIAGAFTVTAIVAAGKKVLDFADNLSNLSAKTGISASGLQRLDKAFLGSGVSLDTVTDNIGKLSKNLIGGDKSAVAAMEKLGLNVDTLKTLAPDRLFLTVADAVGKIQNPTERSFAAMTVFGKGGSELLQGLTGHLKETADAATGVIPDETIAAADKFGDEIEGLGKQLIAALAKGLTPLLPALSGLATVLGKVLDVVGPVTAAIIDWTVKGLIAAYSAILKFLAGIADLATHIPILGKHFGFAADAAEYLRSKAAGADEYLVSLFTSTKDVTTATRAATPPMIGIGDAVKAAGSHAKDTADSFSKLAKEAMSAGEATAKFLGEQLAKIKPQIFDAGVYVSGVGAGIIKALDTSEIIAKLGVGPSGPVAQALARSGTESAASFTTSFNAGLKGLGSAILGALQGGGSVLKSIGSSFGLEFSKSLFGSDKFASSITKTFGGALGGMFNSLLPGIGALAGPLLSKIAGLFGGIFGGPSKQEKAGRSASDAFTAELASALDWMQKIEVHQAVAAGSSEKWATQVVAIRDAYLKAGHSAEEAMAMVDRLWKAEKQGGNAVQQVIDEIVTAMHSALPSAADATEAALTGAFDSIGQGAAAAAESVRGISEEAATAYRALLALRGFNGGSGGEGTSEGKNESHILDGLSEAAAHDAYLSTIANSGSTSQDWERVKSQYGFAMGTGGQYLDFGAGTPVMLHRRERVMTEGEGRADAAAWTGMASELAAIKRLLSTLPRAVGDAVVLAR